MRKEKETRKERGREKKRACVPRVCDREGERNRDRVMGQMNRETRREKLILNAFDVFSDDLRSLRASGRCGAISA